MPWPRDHNPVIELVPLDELDLSLPENNGLLVQARGFIDTLHNHALAGFLDDHYPDHAHSPQGAHGMTESGRGESVERHRLSTRGITALLFDVDFLAEGGGVEISHSYDIKIVVAPKASELLLLGMNGQLGRYRVFPPSDRTYVDWIAMGFTSEKVTTSPRIVYPSI